MKTMPQITLTCREYAGRVRRMIDRLHRDDRGAEGLEKLLIVAAIVLPLLGVLLIFRNEISLWVDEKFSEVRRDGEVDPLDSGGNPNP